jgi:hypothetical protein
MGENGKAVVEIAGRDSIAAAFVACGERVLQEIIPTYAFTGTEWGSWSSVERAVERLKARLPRTLVSEIVLLHHEDFWHALNGRFLSELFHRYGFYTPCVGCHLYLHAVRIPLALKLGGIPIVAGERLSHDGIVKINQTRTALSAYSDLAAAFGVELLFPLRDVESGKAVKEILGFEWAEGEQQMSCVFSGNYRRIDGTIPVRDDMVESFLRGFALPAALRIVGELVEGRRPDCVKIAGDVLRAASVKNV